MWPFKKTARQRRLEMRRPARPGESRWEGFARAGGIGATLLALLLAFAAVAMDLYPVEPFGYRAGQYLPEAVHARVRFRVLSQEQLEQATGVARRLTPAVFQLDAALMDELSAQLKNLPLREAPTTRPAEAGAAAGEPSGAAGPAVAAPTGGAATDADPNRPDPLRRLAQDANALAAYHEAVDALARRLADLPVVRLAEPEAHKPQLRWPQRAVLIGSGSDAPRDAAELIDVDNTDRLRSALASLVPSLGEGVRQPVLELLLGTLSQRPVYRYDRRATQDRMDAAVAAVEADPPDEVFREYDVGEPIARRTPPGDTDGLSAAELALLRAEHEAFRAEQAARPLTYWGRVGGRAAVLLLVVAVLNVYIVRYQPRLTADRLRAAALLVLLVGMLAANKLLVGVFRLNPYASVLPVLMIGTVLTIAWDHRFALAVGSALVAIIVLHMRGSIEPFVVLTAGLATVIFRQDQVRTRTKLIRTAAEAAVVVFLGVWITGLARALPWHFALTDATWAAGAALLSGFVAQGALPLIERAFHVATNLTLLEWCDASKPILKRLAMEAPGTYNHSLQLGAMCETAAEAIDARGLLARVGAYYHDIGKINKPDYFIENQAGTTGSKHDKLSPAMSLLVITGHVKDGLELAREYGLPQVLHEFITTHHGTTLVQYFYHAAAEQRKENADRAPDETEFRYPGPKPRSKEPAILMLADAAESSVRAMADPTPGRIENQVHTMVTRRLMDGQLDHCELTLREVHLIEASLIKSLCSMYHARIAYPTPAGEKPSAAERKPDTKTAKPPGSEARTPGEKPKQPGEGGGRPGGEDGDAGAAAPADPAGPRERPSTSPS